MRKNPPRRIDRETAERLLDGRPLGHNAGHEALADLLAAAAAPAAGHGKPQPGEAAAVAAFLEARRGTARRPRRASAAGPGRVTALRGAKALAAAFAVTAVCGVAVAAGTGNLPGVPGGDRTVAPSDPGATAAPTGSGSAGSPSTGPSGPVPGTSPGHLGTRPGTIGLCRAWSAADAKERGRMLASPPFSGLIREAGGKAEVTAYCAALLDEAKHGGAKPKATPTPTRVPAPGKTRGGAETKDHPTAKPEKTPGAESGHANGSG